MAFKTSLIHRPKTTPQQSTVRFFPSTGLRSSSGFADSRYLPDHDLTRQEFEQYVKTNFGLHDVHTGTQSEQEGRLTRHNMPAQSITGWRAWDPGSISADYTSIILGIEDMIKSLGAIPSLQKIVFFQQAYDPQTSGSPSPAPDVGASFGAGEMSIFEAFHRSSILPVNRSSVPGSGAPPVRFAYGGRSQYIRQNITHELGHGVAEAAMSQNNQTFVEFRAAVGWIGTNPEVLYDIQQLTVLAAIAQNIQPPSQHIITPARWNDHTVLEQPMSRYSVKGEAAEDLAESIMAYIHQNAALLQRSPARHQFIRTHLEAWLTKMKQIMPAVPRPPIGDFPIPDTKTRYV